MVGALSSGAFYMSFKLEMESASAVVGFSSISRQRAFSAPFKWSRSRWLTPGCQMMSVPRVRASDGSTPSPRSPTAGLPFHRSG